MSNQYELSPYDHVGHDSWKAYKAWMSQPDFDGKPLPEDKVKLIIQRALDLGMSEQDIQQAILEGEIAAQIQLDPDFASTQSISGLKEESRNILSPLACVARELSLISMIQKGEITAFVTKDDRGDILPELQQALKDSVINP